VTLIGQKWQKRQLGLQQADKTLQQTRQNHTQIQALRTGATGLEPAASGVTGRRSNQLSYAPEESGGLGGPPDRQN
jgi:hypothetical protein